MANRRAWAQLGQVVATGVLVVGCSSGLSNVPGGEVPEPSPQDPEVTRASFDQALDQLAKHDQAGDWTEAACQDVARAFEEVAESNGKHQATALYNAGLSYQRCGQHEEARAHFEQARAVDPGQHRAQVQLVLYDYRKSGNVSRAITDLSRIIRAAKFQNVEALVSLAALQMQRASAAADDEGPNDFERARKNLQRALAIDDRYMPAYNQLAIYYLELARQRADRSSGMVVAGAAQKTANQQQLDLAALVAAQAIRKNPAYAPIHNTAGLVQVELGDFNGAVKSFATARKLDPRFLEAHLNYAAVNLSFRGFQAAEQAYRDVLVLDAKSYEAHLGLALALRGQVGADRGSRLVSEAQQHLDAARSIAPDRPETYYNEAILTQEFKAKVDEASSKPMLRKAAELYGQFIARAGARPEFAEAVRRAEERRGDIQQMLEFMNDS